jgi:hypothetical protein
MDKDTDKDMDKDTDKDMDKDTDKDTDTDIDTDMVGNCGEVHIITAQAPYELPMTCHGAISYDAIYLQRPLLVKAMTCRCLQI